MKNLILNILFFLAAVGIAIILLISGCATLPVTKVPVKPTPTTAIIWQTISSTDWLMSVFLIAIVCAIFAGLNGVKAGWAGAFAAFVGILLKAALSNAWIYVAAGLVLVGCILLLVASIIWKNRAFVDILKGAQAVKNYAVEQLNANRVGINKMLSDEQNPSTQKLVQQVKSDLKLKGEIE